MFKLLTKILVRFILSYFLLKSIEEYLVLLVDFRAITRLLS